MVADSKELCYFDYDPVLLFWRGHWDCIAFKPFPCLGLDRRSSEQLTSSLTCCWMSHPACCSAGTMNLVQMSRSLIPDLFMDRFFHQQEAEL